MLNIKLSYLTKYFEPFRKFNLKLIHSQNIGCLINSTSQAKINIIDSHFKSSTLCTYKVCMCDIIIMFNRQQYANSKYDEKKHWIWNKGNNVSWGLWVKLNASVLKTATVYKYENQLISTKKSNEKNISE